MSESIQAKRERRNALAKDTRNILDQNQSTWTPENQTKYDENIAEIERIDAAIDRHQKVMDLTAEREFENMGGHERDGTPTDAAQIKLFDKWTRGGDGALSAEEWSAVRNTMSTGTDSEGGYTVPATVASSILDALKAYGGMRAVADVIRTAGGESMNWPTSDGTAEEGEIVAENASASDADVSFGTKGLGVYKYSSKVVTVPIELLQDSSADIEGFVRGRL
jgi:HK97 family phage major capsid protein